MFSRVRLAALAAAVAAFAAAPAPAAPTTQTPVDPQVLEVVKELHHAHQLLTEAEHDYDGHRGKAAEEVHKAVKALEAGLPHHHHHTQPAKAPSTKGQAPVPDQAVSDQLLREARKALQKVEKHLSASSSVHAQQALADVSRAVEEIDAALKLK